MKLGDITIGKKYINTRDKKAYLAVDKNEHEVFVYLSETKLLYYPKKGSEFLESLVEYDEDFHKPFQEEVRVILYKGGEFIIDNGYDESRLDENEARVFKAVLKEIT